MSDPNSIDKSRIISADAEIRELLENGNTRYGLQALVSECSALSQTKKGFRNTALNEAACKLGSLVAAGQLGEETVRETLIRSCRDNGLLYDNGGMVGVEATIRSGFKKGMTSPRYPIEREHEPEASSSGGTLDILKMSDVKMERLSWLWEGVLAEGKLSFIAGDPGLGKSQVSLNVAAIVSSGGKWPVSGQQAKQGNVIIISGEDDPADTIKPRLVAAGADLDRVLVVPSVTDGDGKRVFDLKRDVAKLEDAIEQIGGCTLVIIDPITSYLGKADLNHMGDMRGITAQLQALGHKHNTCVLCIHHLNKRQGDKAAYRMGGSLALQAAARTVFIVDKDGDSEERRIMTPAKNNLAPDTTSFAFTLESVELPDAIKTSRVVWETSSHSNTADRVLIANGDGGDALSDAKAFLIELLKNGRVPSEIANKAANDNQISASTLLRAKRSLNVGGVTPDNGVTWYVDYKNKAA